MSPQKSDGHKNEIIEKSEVVSSVTTIASILKIERQKWCALVLLQIINDGIVVCTGKVFSDTTKKTTSHVFVYNSHFTQKEMS